MAMLDVFDRIQAEVGVRVAAVVPSQLGDPTPCGDWDVRTLLDHLVSTNAQYAAIANGTEAPAEDPGHRAGDHVAAYAESVATARAAFARPGMLEQRYDFPWGAETGEAIVSHVADELLIHGWDLARATGQPTDLAPDDVPASLARWRAWFDGFGGGPRPEGGPFGPERTAPAGAPAADHLAAYLGRIA